MTTIDPSQRLNAALRAQLATLRERAGARGQPAGRTGGAERPRNSVSAAMASRIQAIAPQDPDAPGKAVRIYLEAELAREFGAPLLNDPSFGDMLDAVQQQMHEDVQTAAAVRALGQLLLAGKIPVTA